MPEINEFFITVNGKEQCAVAGTTVGSLLESRKLLPGSVVVERNGFIAAREEFGNIVLGAGDRLEIIRFVGGG